MTKQELQKLYDKERGRIKSQITKLQKKGFSFDNVQILPQVPKRITEGSIRRLQRISTQTIQRKGTYTSPETGKTITGKTYVEKQKRKKLTPKKTSKEKAEKTRDAHYKQTGKKKGTKSPPNEAAEIIFNVGDGFSGRIESIQDQEPDWYFYPEEEQPDYELTSSLSRLKSKEYGAKWSKSLIDKKESERQTAVTLINNAISLFGYKEIARRIQESATEVSNIIDVIMYAGYGRSYITGRNEVKTNLARLAQILSGGALNFETNSQLTEKMDTYGYDTAFYSDVLE